MDSLTHLALGHAMGVFAKGSTPAIQSAAYWGAFVGNSLPDIDVTVGHLIGKGWSLHRKFTHTLPGMLSLSVLATGVITWAVPGSNPLLTFAWTLVGCIVHVFLDCLNLFGTRPFWPFSQQTVGLGVLFLLDPVILGLLGLGSIAQLAGWVSVGLLKGLYGVVWLYVAARWLLLGAVKRKLCGPGTARAQVAPFFLGWRFFREREGRLEFGTLAFFGSAPQVLETIEPARGPAVDASRQVPAVAVFLQKARMPYARVEQDGGVYRVIWQDLFARFRGRGVGLAVTLDSNLQVVK
ncbi:MAG TPA: metal-dependent hydrolase [Symbiobacteriaceae bacterium]|nr:metal-dependent hydrolase [Symbiobacteriaceae bacterium]